MHRHLHVFWGKAKSGQQTEWHPAVLHMADVGLAAGALWNDFASPKVKRWVSARINLEGREVRQWLCFLVALHDLGKVSPGFQCKVEPLRDRVKRVGFSFPPNPEADHGLVTRATLPDLICEVVPSIRRRDSEVLATSVAAHHGRFHSREKARRAKYRAGGMEWDEARLGVVEALADCFELTQESKAPTLQIGEEGPLVLWLAGFTTLADWIGSDCCFFPYETGRHEGLRDYSEQRRKCASDAVAAFGLDSSSFAQPPARTFQEAFRFDTPRPMQQVIAEFCNRNTPELLVIEAPTGSGKTEAALSIAEAMGVREGLQGAYVAMPTMATSNNMFNRVRHWRAGMPEAAGTEFHLLHGRALLFSDYEAQFRSIGEPWKQSTEGLAASRWFHGRKRGLLAPFAVGTIDQALLSVLDSRHVFLRLFALAGKVLILDEVHAFDTYTTTLIQRLLRWARALGCRVVLLSATLPSAKLRELIHSWAPNLPGSEPTQKTPRATLATECEIKQIPLPLDGIDRPDVAIVPAPGELSAIRDQVLGQLDRGGCAGCICNTVARAQTLYSMFRARLRSDELTLLHARMPLAERLRREQQVHDALGPGKETPRPNRHVVIGTQVLEQSLDVDFDVMFSELAPVDLIIQRIGRLHRHERQRPSTLKNPSLLLESPNTNETEPILRHSDVAIYSRSLLLKTLYALRNASVIRQSDAQKLIESVYGDQAIELSDDERQLVEETAMRDEERRKQDEAKARAKLLVEPDNDNIPNHPQLSGELEEDAPGLHRAFQALTRLGRPSVTLIFLHRQEGRLYTGDLQDSAIDPTTLPDRGIRRRLIEHSIPVSQPHVYRHFMDTDVPPSWRKDPILRYTRLVELENGMHDAGTFRLRLDLEFGLLIESGPEAGGTDGE